jgi:Zn-dependent peptidase ImmA (M78 family)
VTADEEAISKGILGRITFTPPSIEIYHDAIGARRERFTLAHELGHLLLEHGEYLRAESFDTQDLEQSGNDDLESDMIRRLEWQANRFASSLLLPREQFIQSALIKAESMGLRNKGFGLIYLDNQAVNQRNYIVITSALMDQFDVSRKAVEIRLKDLELLRG